MPCVAVDRGYLATLTLQASQDAEGTFTVDLLGDGSDAAHRTFVFTTDPRERIDVYVPGPAIVEVRRARR